jgi:hypothetical protein
MKYSLQQTWNDSGICLAHCDVLPKILIELFLVQYQVQGNLVIDFGMQFITTTKRQSTVHFSLLAHYF